MAAEKLMLQGRYFSKVRKYGVIGGTASIVGGIVTYFVVKQRRANMENYFASLTPEKQQEANERCLKYQGVTRNEKFPHIPMLDNSEGKFTGFFEKYKMVDFWLKAEKVALSSVDPELLEYYPELFLYGIRDDWYENEAKKVEGQRRLASARSKLQVYVQTFLKEEMQTFAKNKSKKNKVESNLTNEDVYKVLVMSELFGQKKEGIQDVATPLAVKYLPKAQE